MQTNPFDSSFSHQENEESNGFVCIQTLPIGMEPNPCTKNWGSEPSNCFRVIANQWGYDGRASSLLLHPRCSFTFLASRFSPQAPVAMRHDGAHAGKCSRAFQTLASRSPVWMRCSLAHQSVGNCSAVTTANGGCTRWRKQAGSWS